MDNLILSADSHCRACLQRSQNQMYSMASKSVSIDSTNRQTQFEIVKLANVYNECTQLIYEQMNPNWEWICEVCFAKLVEFFEFRKMCIDSYEKLQAIEKQRFENNDIELKVEMVDVSKILEQKEDDGLNNDDLFDMDSMKASDYKDHDEDIELGIENFPDTKHQTKETKEEDEDIDNNSSFTNFLSDIKQETTKEQTSESALPPKQKSTKAKKSNSTEVIYVCDVCSMKFFKKHRYDAHMRKHLGLKQWKCDHCEKEFEKYSSLKSHIAAMHDDSEKKIIFICDVNGCGKSYSLKESLRVHIKHIHAGKKPNMATKICEQCGKSFKSNASLIKHTYTHTKVSPHKCHICSKMFPTKYKLKEHVMRHEGIKNFVCPICGLRKTTGHELRVHMTHHSNDTQFPCELCSIVFTRMANMKRHMRVVHCGIKAYPCPHCDRSFGKSETLKHHVMTHTGQKPHACSICDKRFIQPIALKTHMKTHNKDTTRSKLTQIAKPKTLGMDKTYNIPEQIR